MIRDPEDGLIHLHLFSHATDRPPEGIVAAIQELDSPHVLYGSQYVGSFQAYTHVTVDTLADSMRLANALWPKGLRTEMSSEVKISGIRGPKRASPRFNALIRIRPDGNPLAFLDELDRVLGPNFDPETYWYGAAVVTGRGYDVLVDLGRPTLEELVDAVLNDLREVEGIGRTDTSWADLDVNSFRRESDS
jgi:hypothetical protein